MNAVELDTKWERVGGKEVVIVRRVWLNDEGWTVRAHPIRGGKALVADRDWFTEHFRRISDEKERNR